MRMVTHDFLMGILTRKYFDDAQNPKFQLRLRSLIFIIYSENCFFIIKYFCCHNKFFAKKLEKYLVGTTKRLIVIQTTKILGCPTQMLAVSTKVMLNTKTRLIGPTKLFLPKTKFGWNNQAQKLWIFIG